MLKPRLFFIEQFWKVFKHFLQSVQAKLIRADLDVLSDRLLKVMQQNDSFSAYISTYSGTLLDSRDYLNVRCGFLIRWTFSLMFNPGLVLRQFKASFCLFILLLTLLEVKALHENLFDLINGLLSHASTLMLSLTDGYLLVEWFLFWLVSWRLRRWVFCDTFCLCTLDRHFDWLFPSVWRYALCYCCPSDWL